MKKRILIGSLLIGLLLTGCGEQTPIKSAGPLTVTLCNYKGLKIEVENISINEEEKQQYLDWMLSTYTENIGEDPMEDGVISDNEADKMMELADITGYSGTEGLYQHVDDFFEAQNETQKQEAVRTAIQDKLIENCTVENLPSQEVEVQVDEFIEEMKETAKNTYQITFEEYLEKIETTEKDYREDIREFIERDLKIAAILDKIIETEGITLDEQLFDESIDDIVTGYGYTSKDLFYTTNGGEDNVKSVFLYKQVTDWIAGQADITYKELGEH